MSGPRCCARAGSTSAISRISRKKSNPLVHNREREIGHRLAAIMAMLVRNVYDRERRPTDKMKIHRGQIMCVVRGSPSLRPRLADPQALDTVWTRMLCDHEEHGSDLPETCPWTPHQVLNGALPRDVLTTTGTRSSGCGTRGIPECARIPIRRPW